MEDRTQQAIALHNQGYNCAQAVVCAYHDCFGIDRETAYRVAEGFGFGMGNMEVCGALSGLFLLAGLRYSGGTEQPGKTKSQTYRFNKQVASAFREKNGTILCRELKGVGSGEVRRSCNGCIQDACQLAAQFFPDE